MNKLSVVFLIGWMFCLHGLNAQTQSSNNTSINKNSISLNILGTGSYVGVSYERLILQRISVELALGVIGYGVGATVYPFKKAESQQFNPFLGIKYTNHAIVDGENKSATYIPLGVTYFSKHRINYSIDIGPSYFKHKSPGFRPTEGELSRYPFANYGIWGNLKIGFRF